MTEQNKLQIKQDIGQYHQKVRVRVCGLLMKEGRLLLLKHDGIGNKGFLWSPPGGGLEFDEDARSCLKREFMEETGLIVSVNEFLFTHEYMDEHLHAIELFFKVSWLSGELSLGHDPELAAQNQVLTAAHFYAVDELNAVVEGQKHSMLRKLETFDQLFEYEGFYFFSNI